jgi:hypothetical protein
MKNKIFKNLSAVMLAVFVSSVSYAGAEVEVTLNNGDSFKWQFFDMVEASEFLADRVESGRCSPQVANVEIRSLWIDGIDEEEDKFAYFHGIENQKIY